MVGLPLRRKLPTEGGPVGGSSDQQLLPPAWGVLGAQSTAEIAPPQGGMRQWISDLKPRAQTGQIVGCRHQLAGNLQRVDPGKLQIRTEGHVQAGVFSVQEPAIESRVMCNNPNSLQLAGQGGGDLCEDRGPGQVLGSQAVDMTVSHRSLRVDNPICGCRQAGGLSTDDSEPRHTRLGHWKLRCAPADAVLVEQHDD